MPSHMSFCEFHCTMLDISWENQVTPVPVFQLYLVSTVLSDFTVAAQCLSIFYITHTHISIKNQAFVYISGHFYLHSKMTQGNRSIMGTGESVMSSHFCWQALDGSHLVFLGSLESVEAHQTDGSSSHPFQKLHGPDYDTKHTMFRWNDPW